MVAGETVHAVSLMTAVDFLKAMSVFMLPAESLNWMTGRTCSMILLLPVVFT